MTMEDTNGICEAIELAAHSTCETCGGPTCSCGAQCPRMLTEATPETYPGWVMVPNLTVCVECAPQWLPEQDDLRVATRLGVR